MEASSARAEPVDTAAAVGEGGRLCAFRQCRAPLPVSTGRGNRPRYCQDGKTWGPNDLTCKTAEAAFVAVDSLLTADSALTPAVLDQLGQRFDEAQGPLDRLLEAVTTVGRQVGEETGAALAARDRALETAAADRGAREAAEALTAQYRDEVDAAGARAAEAVDLAHAAERARARAEQDAAAASREQLRAEGRLTALTERLQRSDELVEATAAQLAELRDQHATVGATLRLTENTLADERTRTRDLLDAHRTELADRDTAAAAQRAEHEAALRRLQDEAAVAAEAAAQRREADLEALRTEHAATREQLIADHAAQLADLHRRLGATDHELELLRRQLSEAAASADEQTGS
ncbi:hypothetical protein [Pseudonocardia xishanensis]|uniref:Uncharacterized protein n=1 Tax=Pseudonocardia xishanensis TaxID=630995 RepID=A0ABP8RZ95_9PSEU